jgi:hypothetical protein
VIQSDDLEVARGGSKNVNLTHALFNGNDLKSLHARLQSANGIDLSDEHTGTSTPHGEGAALSDISVACHQGTLAANHHIGGTHDAVWQGVAAAIPGKPKLISEGKFQSSCVFFKAALISATLNGQFQQNRQFLAV